MIKAAGYHVTGGNHIAVHYSDDNGDVLRSGALIDDWTWSVTGRLLLIHTIMWPPLHHLTRTSPNSGGQVTSCFPLLTPWTGWGWWGWWLLPWQPLPPRGSSSDFCSTKRNKTGNDFTRSPPFPKGARTNKRTWSYLKWARCGLIQMSGLVTLD